MFILGIRNIAILQNCKIKKQTQQTMGASKTNFFPPAQKKIAALCKAFAHPARVSIVEYIITNEECICEELIGLLPLSRATIWQHFQVLLDANIIWGEFKENTFSYSLHKDNIEQVRNYFNLKFI